MPKFLLIHKSTDIDFNYYPKTETHSTTPHQLVRYSENNSLAVLIFFQQKSSGNGEFIRRVTHYHLNAKASSVLTNSTEVLATQLVTRSLFRIDSILEEGYLTDSTIVRNKYSALFREDCTLEHITLYGPNGYKNSEYALDTDSTTILSEKEFQNNQIINLYTYLNNKLSSNTSYQNKIPFQKMTYQPDGITLSLKETYSLDTLQIVLKEKYRQNGILASKIFYQTDKELPLSQLFYLSNGFTFDIFIIYQKNGITISTKTKFHSDNTALYLLNYDDEGKNILSKTFFLPDGRTKFHEIHYRKDGTISSDIHYQTDGITPSSIMNYREDETISSDIHYQTDGITPSYIINYQLDGVTPFAIAYYQPNGLPSQVILYDIKGVPYVQRVYYSDGTTKNFPIQTNPLQLL